ncbi:hypothetical protein Tco_0692034 [Tanacetum coccineum]
MAGVDVDTLTMEQYLVLSRENQAPGVVKPKIRGNVNFEIKSQFMQSLKTQSCSEFFPLLLPEPQKDGWTDSPQELSILGISSKRPLSKGIAHLPRLQNSLKIFTTSSKKETNHYTRPESGIMTYYTSALLMTSIVIKRNIGSNSSNDRLAALVNKLDNLGRDMKKLKESVHAIQVGCQIYEGPHLDKDHPLNEEVKQVEETDSRPPYGERRQSLKELLAKHQEESAQRITANQEMTVLNKLHGVSFISETKSDTPDALQHQLPPKELNLGSFTLPCMIVKIDKFLFLSDFVIINNTPSETTILGRPFLATIHAEIDVFTGKFSLGINEDIISLDTMRKDHNYTNPSEKKFMVNSGLIIRPQSPAQSNNQIDYKESGNWDNRSPNLDDRKPKKWKINLDENVPRAHFCNLIK